MDNMMNSRLLELGPTSPLILVVLLGIICFVSFRVLFRRNTRSYPPGPVGLPLVGNALDIPNDRQWLGFDKWIRRYGNVVGITVMNEQIIILGSMEAAYELLDARGTIYSGRPTAVMAGDLVGWNRGLGYTPLNSRFRDFRKFFHRTIGLRAGQEKRVQEAQEYGAHGLLLRLLNDPSQFRDHFRQTSGRVILHLLFGYHADHEQEEEHVVKVVEVAMQGFALASEPGAWAVDYIPWLKYIPKWFPGAGFKITAQNMWDDRERMYNEPFEFVKRQLKVGEAVPSFVSEYMEDKRSLNAQDEEFIKAAAASLYSGGADTTPSSLSSFVLAIVLNPLIQTRAHAELDSVLGSGFQRLPNFTDRKSLPYVNAIVLEVLRWNPAVPLGLAHKLTQDDTYEGYVLQKGTVVWANIWSMLHDESIFPQPGTFEPERFLDQQGELRTLSRSEDPAIGFGFGRRICPGMHFADNAIFIAVAMMLYVFDISKARDENGREIIPEVEYDGFISHPRPFKCSIKPRSEGAEELIRGCSGEQIGRT